MRGGLRTMRRPKFTPPTHITCPHRPKNQRTPTPPPTITPSSSSLFLFPPPYSLFPPPYSLFPPHQPLPENNPKSTKSTSSSPSTSPAAGNTHTHPYPPHHTEPAPRHPHPSDHYNPRRITPINTRRITQQMVIITPASTNNGSTAIFPTPVHPPSTQLYVTVTTPE